MKIKNNPLGAFGFTKIKGLNFEAEKSFLWGEERYPMARHAAKAISINTKLLELEPNINKQRKYRKDVMPNPSPMAREMFNSGKDSLSGKSAIIRWHKKKPINKGIRMERNKEIIIDFFA